MYSSTSLCLNLVQVISFLFFSPNFNEHSQFNKVHVSELYVINHVGFFVFPLIHSSCFPSLDVSLSNFFPLLFQIFKNIFSSCTRATHHGWIAQVLMSSNIKNYANPVVQLITTPSFLL